ncbi:hypothetical protein NT017_10230 [Prolixibacter sp. NT017]|nr:hypothetical protein NT017_10230 [Prolixibacter sp. NT017]
MTSAVSGGGAVSVSIKNDTLDVRFSAGFASCPMKTGRIKDLNTTPALPDINLGLVANTYTAYIQSGGLYVSGPSGVPISGFNSEFVINLRNFVGITYQLTSTENYIFTREVQTAGVTHNSELTYDKTIGTVQYIDGLGRTKQTVRVGASPMGDDLVKPVRYDAVGREAMKFLAYPGENSDGSYVSADSVGQVGYYTGLYGSNDGTTAFAKTEYDGSPLNRVLKQGAPGYAWQPGQHPVKQAYGTNAANEVKLWKVTNGVLTDGGYYIAATLYKTTTWDENNTQSSNTSRTEEFKDKQGRIVMKVAWNGSTPSRTAYVYDDLGMLRFVLTPDAMADNTVSSSELADYCYQYTYDDRKRMIEKKLPGEGPVYMVYDNRDRLVASQDSNQRALGQWQFIKYDALNRPVMTGIKSLSDSRSSLQSYLDSYSGIYYEYSSTSGIGYTLSNSFSGKFGISESNLLSVTYYDGYSYPGCKTFNSSANVSGYSDSSGSSYYFDDVRGQVTGTRKKVLNGNELTTSGVWLLTTTYYDDRYRVIETLKDLYPQSSGNYEVTSSKYDFTGRVLQSKTLQAFLGNSNTVLETYSYDHMGRMTQIKYKLNSNAEVTLASLDYDEQGHLKRKTLHGAPGAGAQELNYSYNIRGWLSRINNPDVNPSSSSKEKWNMALYYDTTPSGLTANPQYNGNISGMVWNTPYNSGALSPTGKQGYGFIYDGLNRLTAADYGEGSSLTTNANANNVNISLYDQNGNIRNLSRSLKGTGTIDNLSYTYQGNQLKKVDDSANDNVGFTESVSQTTEYTYDGNGNLTTDANKGLTDIQYNYLNLPRKVIAGSQNITYIYTADGTKVEKIQPSGTALYYAGNFVYQGSSLKYILNEEGMVTTPSTPVYLYDLKDHLGNTRLEVNSSGTVTQQTDYYPFGMALKIAGSSDNKYLYNGKELQDDAIGNGTLDWYDYGARFYDAALGRWSVVDPKSEVSRRWSPYVYGFDNPIRFIDPDGMLAGDPQKKEPGIFEQAVAFYLNLLMKAGRSAPHPGNTNSSPGEDMIRGFNQTIMIMAPALDAVNVTEDINANASSTSADDAVETETSPVKNVESGVGELGSDKVQVPTEAYNRSKHYGRTPTAADRKVLGAEKDQVVDHTIPLVQHYYEGDGNGGKPGYAMTPGERKAFAKDRTKMQKQSTRESNSQGGKMSHYSKQQKKKYGLD